MRHHPGNQRFDSLDDDGLIEAANAGDREALVEFFRRHWSDLERLAQRYTPRGTNVSHGADDIMSTMVRQVLSLLDRGNFAPTKAAEAHGLLRTVMRRAIARVFRRQRVEREGLARRRAMLSPVAEPDPTHRPVTQPDVARLIGSLSEPEYRLLLMRLEQRDYREIANALGCSVLAARQRWRALRVKLGFVPRDPEGLPDADSRGDGDRPPASRPV